MTDVILARLLALVLGLSGAHRAEPVGPALPGHPGRPDDGRTDATPTIWRATRKALFPVLEIDGLRLTQSLAILEYLDETRRAGFLPKDPADRARARALAYAVAMDIQPVCNLRVAQHAGQPRRHATTEGWMQHFITLGFQGLEPMLTGTRPPSATATSRGLADLCLVPQVYNAHRWGVDLDSRSRRLTAIAARAEALPEVVRRPP